MSREETLKSFDRLLTVMDDLRVIEMYDEAIISQKPLRDRQGNWVQKFHEEKDSGRYIMSQFRRDQEVEAYLHEHFEGGSPFPKQGGEI